MGIFNGQQVVSGFMVVPQYKWVRLATGVTTEATTSVHIDEYNGKKVALCGAALKYKAPKRSDGKSYALYLNLGVATYNDKGEMTSFRPVIYHAIADGTSATTTRYGVAIIDGSNGMYKTTWSVGSDTPPAYTSVNMLRPGAFDYSLIEADPDCNAVRIYSPVQPDGTGMIEAGTEYEVWGLIREA